MKKALSNLVSFGRFIFAASVGAVAAESILKAYIAAGAAASLVGSLGAIALTAVSLVASTGIVYFALKGVHEGIKFAFKKLFKKEKNIEEELDDDFTPTYKETEALEETDSLERTVTSPRLEQIRTLKEEAITVKKELQTPQEEKIQDTNLTLKL